MLYFYRKWGSCFNKYGCHLQSSTLRVQCCGLVWFCDNCTGNWTAVTKHLSEMCWEARRSRRWCIDCWQSHNVVEREFRWSLSDLKLLLWYFDLMALEPLARHPVTGIVGLHPGRWLCTAVL